MQLHSDEV